MKKTTLATAILLTTGWQGSAVAGLSVEERLRRMEQAMAQMQQKVATQETTIKKQAATIAEQKAFMEGQPKRMKKMAENIEKKRSAVSGADAWYNNIEVDGLIEVEASHYSPYQGDDESDIVLATFELGIASQITDWVEVGGSLLYEQHDTPLEVDVAFATIGNREKSPLFLTAGQVYLPFGAYESNMVSDPLTLEIGETRETTFQAGFVKYGFNGSLYVFNGTNKKDGKNQIGSWGANLGYAAETDAATWAVGIGYISDLGDSDTLQGVIGDNLGSNDISRRVAGWTVHAGAELGVFNLIGEYLFATDSFESAAVPWGLNGAKPSAWNLEAGYSFDLLGKGTTLAVGYQGSREALALELPRERWMIALSMDIMDNTSLSFEWAHDKDYSTTDGGTGKSANTATAQLAFEY